MDSVVKFHLHNALNVLWSAGHSVGPGLMSALETAARQNKTGTFSYDPARGYDVAAAVLLACGFQPDVSKPFPHFLPNVAQEFSFRPYAGHAVRLTGPWSICKAGELLSLSGERPALRYEESFSVGRGGHYWDGGPNDPVSLSCGGPSSILRLKPDSLKATKETAPVAFWRFRGSPEAHTGVNFVRLMPLWEWSGDESDFTSD